MRARALTAGALNVSMKGWVAEPDVRLPQRCVHGGKGVAGYELGVAERVQWRFDDSQRRVHIVARRIDVEQPGDDLALRAARFEIRHIAPDLSDGS